MVGAPIPSVNGKPIIIGTPVAAGKQFTANILPAVTNTRRGNSKSNLNLFKFIML